jgi:hypothetical protein
VFWNTKPVAGAHLRAGAGVLLVVATVSGVACSDSDNAVVGPAAPYVMELGTASTAFTVVQDSSIAIDAAVTADGDTVPNASIAFTSLSPDFVVVGGNTVTGIRGTESGAPALVEVSFENANDNVELADTVSVTVVPNPLAGISVTLPADSVTPGNTVYRGESRPVTALIRDADGDTLYCTQCSDRVARGSDSVSRVQRVVRFSTPDDDIASISADGVITVKDTSAANTGSISVILTSPGDSGAVAPYADTLTVVIGARPVATVSVTPAPAAVSIGKTLELGARVAGMNDADIVDSGTRAVTWSSSDPAIASVDGDGVVTGKAAGTVTITAQAEIVPGSVVFVTGTTTVLVQ